MKYKVFAWLAINQGIPPPRMYIIEIKNKY